MRKFSVITVTYNLIEAGRAETMLAMCQSLWEQDCTDVEHIVQDGGSKDGTVELLNRIKGKAPPHVHTQIFSEPDSGLYEAMNRATDRAGGLYLIFMNSDDAFAVPTALSQIASKNFQNKSDYIFGTYFHVGENGKERHHKRPSLKAILNRMPYCHQSVAIKTDVFRELGGYDLRYNLAADYDLNLRLVGCGYKGRRIDTPIARFHAGGISADVNLASREHAQIWKENFSIWIDTSVYPDEERERWYRQGCISPRAAWQILRSKKANRRIKNSALHSLYKGVRRDIIALMRLVRKQSAENQRNA